LERRLDWSLESQFGRNVFVAGLALFAAHLGWQVRRLDIADPTLCLAVFKSNRDAGLVLFAAIALDGLVRHGL